MFEKRRGGKSASRLGRGKGGVRATVLWGLSWRKGRDNNPGRNYERPNQKGWWWDRGLGVKKSLQRSSVCDRSIQTYWIWSDEKGIGEKGVKKKTRSKVQFKLREKKESLNRKKCGAELKGG